MFWLRQGHRRSLIKSATVAGKGAETLHNEIYSYSKQSIEDSHRRQQGDHGRQVGA